MSILTDFFDRLTKGSRWDVGVSIKRTNPLPLDDKSVFSSYTELEKYLESTDDAPTLAYPGQVVTVVEADNVVLYVLNAELSPVPVMFDTVQINGMGVPLELTEQGIVDNIYEWDGSYDGWTFSDGE
jgi:hypothetical protein